MPGDEEGETDADIEGEGFPDDGEGLALVFGMVYWYATTPTTIITMTMITAAMYQLVLLFFFGMFSVDIINFHL